jgi:hypothetical protein
MPKVSVYEDPDTAGQQTRRVEVGWQKGCAVQVGISVRNPAVPHVEFNNPDGSTTDVSEHVTITAGADPAKAWDGQFMELSRTQVNALIRHLRAARDAAFGRDE